MAMLRYSTATIVEPCISTDKWANDVYEQACTGDKCRMKTAKSVMGKYDPRKYLLSHSTIIAAVDTELADPNNPKSDYYIHPAYSKFVNNNGDAWSKKLLKETYRTFIGCNNYCFPAGTRILMSDGTYKPIEIVQIGDKVINRKGEIGTVTETFCNQTDKLVELSGKNILSRKLFVTPEHPFWIYQARKTCPKTGRPNFFNKEKDFARLTSWLGFSTGVHRYAGETYPVGITPDWVEAKDIDPDRNFFSHPISDIEIENSEINENRAELIGWFLAEGSYQQINLFRPGEESGVVFNLGNTEQDVAGRIEVLLQKEFGENFRVDCKPRTYETESGSLCTYVSNKVVADYFKKWCGKYAWAKRMPEEAMFLPKKLQAIILHCCIDGDGSNAVVSRGYSLEMKSRALIQQFTWISCRLGLLPTYKETGVLKRYTECNIVDGFEIFTDPETSKKSRPGYMLRLSTRDSKELNRIINRDDGKISSRESNRITNILGDGANNWLLSKIDDKKIIDVTCPVYNIAVDNDNSYIAEGIIVHNCEHVQIPELSKGKVIDAVLREIPIGKDRNGRDLTTYYVDILVATDRKHADLVRKIESGELDKMSMGCFLEGTEITLSTGIKQPIQVLVPGDQVITHIGQVKPILNVQKKWYVGKILAVKVQGDHKTTFVTPEHPFWSFRREQECACGCGEKIHTKLTGHKNNFDGKDFVFSKYKRGHYARVVNPNAKTYSLDDYRALKEGSPIKGKLDLSWFKAGDLKVGDLVSYPVSDIVHNTADASVEKSRLLGYYLAEGSFVKEVVVEGEENDYGVRCRVCGKIYNMIGTHLPVHDMNLEKYHQLYPDAPIKAKIDVNLIRSGSKDDLSRLGLSKTRKNIGVEFSLGSHEYDTLNKEIAELASTVFPDATVLRYEESVKIIGEDVAYFFHKHCGEYFDGKKLSEEILYWDVNIQKHLLATWLLGDAGTTGSKQLSDQLHFIFSRCRVIHNRYKREASLYKCNISSLTADGTEISKTYEGARSESYYTQVNSHGCQVLEDELSYAFMPTNKKFALLDKEQSGLHNWKHDWKFRNQSQWMMMPITSIEEMDYEGWVYNFEVDGDNSYIANDIAVHNCTISYSVCTRCGNKAVDETQACQHIKYEKNNMFFDDNGVQRKTAELCGHCDDPDSVKFVDASWVRTPAFVGAVKRNNIYPSSDVMSKLEEAFKKKGYQVKESDFLKAAAMILLAQAKDDPPAAEPPKEEAEATPEDTPPEATPTDEPPAAPAGEAPAEGAPPAEGTPPPGMPPAGEGESDIKKFKNMVKQKILKQLSDEISDEFSEEEDAGAPRELETLDESMIKPASDASKVWSLKDNERSAYHKIGSHLASLLKDNKITRKEFDKLRYGSYMILASKDLTLLADYGYTKRDFLATLSYLDGRTNKPLPIEIKKAIAKMGGSGGNNPSKILMDIVSSIGRKITKNEGARSLMWIKLLDGYRS